MDEPNNLNCRIQKQQIQFTKKDAVVVSGMHCAIGALENN